MAKAFTLRRRSSSSGSLLIVPVLYGLVVLCLSERLIVCSGDEPEAA